MLSTRVTWLATVLALAQAPAPAFADTIQIVIEKMAFLPAIVQAKAGDTIEWINKDKFAHTATVKGGWEVMLPVGKSGTMTIAKAGSIDYFCRFHPNMTGHIDVVP